MSIEVLNIGLYIYFFMPKSMLHISIDTYIIERCKANKMNISKEVEQYLDHLLSKPVIDRPESVDLAVEIRNKEIEFNDLQHDINKLKELQTNLKKKEEEEKEKALYEHRMRLSGKIIQIKDY